MAIKDKDYSKKIEIDLTGPQGNAYYLLSYAASISRQLGHSSDTTEYILEDMKSGDYENLIQVFDRAFGEYVDLLR